MLASIAFNIQILERCSCCFSFILQKSCNIITQNVVFFYVFHLWNRKMFGNFVLYVLYVTLCKTLFPKCFLVVVFFFLRWALNAVTNSYKFQIGFSVRWFEFQYSIRFWVFWVYRLLNNNNSHNLHTPNEFNEYSYGICLSLSAM